VPAQRIQIGGEEGYADEGRLFEGDSEDLEFPMVDEKGEGLDLDAAGTVEFHVFPSRPSAGDKSNAVFSKTRANGGISTRDDDGDGTNEVAIVSLTESDTSGVVEGTLIERLYLELWVKDGSGEPQTMYYGPMVVDGSAK